MIVAIIKRGNEILISRGDLVLEEADLLVLGAEPYEDDEHITLKEVVLKTHNPWTGLRIRDLDISRQSIIVLVKRRNKSLIPNGNMKLEAGDRIQVLPVRSPFIFIDSPSVQKALTPTIPTPPSTLKSCIASIYKSSVKIPP